MRALLALAGKDLRHLMRDRAGALFTFGVPVVFALFFGTVFADGSESSAIPIAVVDEDGTELSQAYIEHLQVAGEVEITALDREMAAEQVRRGELVGYVVLPEGFGAFQGRLVRGESVLIEVGIDPARAAEASLLRGVLTAHFFDLLIARLTDPDASRPLVQSSLRMLELMPGDSPLERLLGELDTFLATLPSDGELPSTEPEADGGTNWQPLTIAEEEIRPDEAGPRNAYQISFPQGLIWGLISCVATFAIALVQERTNGTLVRLCVAPISRATILGGKALACFVATVVLIVGLFAFGAVVFGVRPSSVPLFALVTIVIAASFTGIMMLLGLVGRTERATAAIGWSFFMVMAMFGGGMLPLFFMPEWMQSVSHLSPVKWAVLAIEGTIWRGFDLPELLPALGVLLAVGGIAFAIGVVIFNRSGDTTA